MNVINPNGASYLSGSLQVQHLNGITGATVATGTGAGTGATDTISYATDLSGVITIHTGTTVSSSAPIFTVSYEQAYTKAPACIVDAQNSAAACARRSSTPLYASDNDIERRDGEHHRIGNQHDIPMELDLLQLTP